MSASPVEIETNAQLPIEWRRWLAENRLLGFPPESLCEEMVAEGFDPVAVRTELTAIDASPLFAAGGCTAQRLRKLEALLTMRQQLARLAPAPVIPQRSAVSSEEFLREHYAANQPVVLTDVTTGWPAMHSWSPEYLAGVLGDEAVEIVGDRDSDTDYEINSVAHKRLMKFSEYVRFVTAGHSSNDAYLVANNHLLERPAAEPLLNDFSADGRYLQAALAPGSAFLWFGPAGTITPLHQDVTNVIFVQLRGRKRITLISPLESHCLYNDIAVYSNVDLLAPDLELYPRFAQARQISLIVEAGQALFIPVGWWHHVEALDVSISLSFTGFRWSNSFEFAHPSVGR